MPRKYGLKNLVVNSLGEVCSKTETGFEDVCGSVDLTSLSNRLGRDPNQKDIAKEFVRSLVAAVTPAAAKRVQDTWRLQKQNTGRFRVWMAQGGKIYLSTEFSALLENKEAWSAIDAAAKVLGVEPELMHELPHLDKSSHDGGRTWIEGEHHGKMERQVSFEIPLPDHDTRTLKRLMKTTSKATDAAWHVAGVGVI